MEMPNRKYTASSSYRYGFNGKENDNEVKGSGNQQDYGMRIYDTRIGKFLSVDPLTTYYPWYSPYQFAGNNPIRYIDLDGGEPMDPMGAAIHYHFIGENAAKRGEDPVAAIKAHTRVLGTAQVVGVAAGVGIASMSYWAVPALSFLSTPQGQMTMTEGASFMANLLYEGPDDPFPTVGPGGELGKLLRGIPKIAFNANTEKVMSIALGKVRSGLISFADKNNLIHYENWNKAFSFGKEALVSWTGEFKEALNNVVSAGGKIIFKLDDVDIDAAKKGYSSFVDAKNAINSNGTKGQITEWELSQILNNADWLKNTIFYKNGKIVDGAKEGLTQETK